MENCSSLRFVDDHGSMGKGKALSFFAVPSLYKESKISMLEKVKYLRYFLTERS